MRHIVSFLRSPIGYVANLIATLTVYIPLPAWADHPICYLCETFCINDGVQDDCLF